MVKKNKQEKSGKKARDRELPAPGDLQQELARASRSMRTFLTRALSASGLYAGQEAVIVAIARSGPMTAGAIAAALGVKPPTVTRTLSRMEAQGFVERIADDGDGRLVRAGLTERGRRQIGAVDYASRATELFALHGLSDKEVRQFMKVLRKINANFGDQPADGDGFGA